jgi:enterochelin esterase family protein
MDRPDVFGAVGSHAGDAAFEVSMRPMLTTAAIAFERAGGLQEFTRRLDDGGPRDAMDFEGVLVLAMAAAYSPEPAAPWPHVELPFHPRTAQLRSAVWERWLDHDPLRRIEAAAESLRGLRRIFLDAGDRDEHGLHFAARLMAEAMRTIGAPLEYEEFEGGHRGTSWRYEVSFPRLVSALEPWGKGAPS